MTGWLFLIFGVLFLLADLAVWNFWGIQWWTVFFVLSGLVMICTRTCEDCCALMYGDKKKK
jgi:hypothetical protein